MNKDDFKIKIFADGADIDNMIKMYQTGLISGFTTNPTLMKKAGVKNYRDFALKAIEIIPNLPISFEVFSDDFKEMEVEARKIGSWGKNIYVKIPIINTKGESSINLIRKLSSEGLKLNITAILTIEQVEKTLINLIPGVGAYISVFAGRIADTGIDPVPVMQKTAKMCSDISGVESLWASSREILNIYQAQACNVDIITVTDAILEKIPNLGKDLNQLTLETVKMFYNDAISLRYKI